MIKIFYLCDRKKECSKSLGCGTDCKHTKDVNHALNGPCDVPEFDDRFEYKFNSWIEVEKNDNEKD